ncbi:LSU ribosomal protein L10P [Archaeoglobus sulfaticallidus PM70-1]|uniref:Large ribosomal subunit protein uL10 n=1 Tax=Archaeoglobus sulfaticallidus PM70-1 TaxID=387631 RepID=N0BN45_9EURY|nr:50S ribosomal protein L10 [Archaeoglobus sulfaticallidus]AGK62021.1 LSU ribosomal protein L10P [Archaeoglobus sulfaticallidus PM70-1]
MAAVRGAVPQWKLKDVEELKELMKNYQTIGIVSFRGVPAGQMQKIRRELRDKVKIKVVKNTLIEKAIEEAEEFESLKEFLGDQVAFVASDMNPFKLFKELEKTKEPSPLKPNQVSPVDVVVEKGPTSFPPGPVLGDLQMGGLPAAIEKGKIVIKDTVTVVRAGEVVKPEVAKALSLLEIKPVKLGLDTRVLMEKGIVFTPEDLAIDVEAVSGQFTEAYTKALNLAVNSAYVIPETAEILIAKAFMNAKNLAVNAGLPVKEAIPEILGKAYSEMMAIASLLPEEALDEDLLAKVKSVEVQKVETVSVEEEKKEEEEEVEEEEESKEEEAIEGLGALFG